MKWPFALASTVDYWRLKFSAERERSNEIGRALRAANAELHKYKVLLGRCVTEVRSLKERA